MVFNIFNMWEEEHLEQFVGLEQPGFIEGYGPEDEKLFMLPSFKEGKEQKFDLNKRDEVYWGNIVSRMNVGEIIWVRTKNAGKYITIGFAKYNPVMVHIIDGWPPGEIPGQRMEYIRRICDAAGVDVEHVGTAIRAQGGMGYETQLAFVKAKLHGLFPYVLGFPSTYEVFYPRLQIIATALLSYYSDMADDGLHPWHIRHDLGVYELSLVSLPLRETSSSRRTPWSSVIAA
jgi:hypothetical protein